METATEITPIDEFITKQKSLLTLEMEAEIQQHKELIETLSIGELEQAGLCLSKLVIDNMKNGLYGKILYSMQASNYDKQALEANESLRAKMTEKFSRHRFGPGDVVGLYEYQDNKGPDFSSRPALEGVVYRTKEFKIILSVNEPPDDPSFQKRVFYMILMANEVTYNRYIKALDRIKKVKESQEYHSQHLLRVLLENESPEVENPYNNRADLAKLTRKDVNFKDATLNEDQKEAIVKALAAKSIFLVHGPPGTGKTKTVCEFINQCVQRKLRVLACAASNIAVDNMVERIKAKGVKCCRLGHPARLLPTVLETCLDNLVSKDESRKDLRSNKKEINALLKQLAKTTDREARKTIRKTIAEREKEIRTLERGAVIDTLTNSEVILCTNTGAGDRLLQDYIEKTVGKAFDVVVIDECAQALEVSCWIPLVYGKKVVLAGDHLQLPPTIKSKEAEKQGLSVTLFDRLMKKYEEGHSQILRTQYRMNKQIMEWSSKEVYQGKLLADKSVENHCLLDLRGEGKVGENGEGTVLMLIDTSGCQMGESVSQNEGQSKYNIGEADLVRVLVKELVAGYQLQNSDIGIITPYNAQVDLIRQELQKEHVFKGVECSTVDGFQGREKEVIIISMVRSNPKGNIGFLGEFRRMNVAVTRAKRFVAIICDGDTVKHDKFLKTLVDYFEANGEVRTAKEFQADKSVRFGEGFIGKDQAQKEKPKEKDANNAGQEANKAKKKKNKKKDNANNAKQEEVEIQAKLEEKVGDFKKIEKLGLEAIFKRIDEFVKNPKLVEYHLPSTLDNLERKEVHIYAKTKDLNHESVGEGEDRHVVLRKKQVEGQGKVIEEEEKKEEVIIQPKKEETTAKKEAVKPKVDNKPAPAQKNEQKKKDKAKAQAKKEDELDDDAFLDMLIERNKSCHFLIKENTPCPGNVSTLGVICKFCKFKFCTKHSLAENHGCGDIASAQAKADFRGQFYSQNGYDTLKTLKKDEEDYLKKRLGDKISNQTSGRGVKQADGKDNKKKGKK